MICCSLLLAPLFLGVAQEDPTAPQALELTGTFVPAEAEEIHLWPQGWKGELMFLEVMAHGSMVEEGQVIARFDTEGIERQIEDAEFALEDARFQLEMSAQRNELEEHSGELRVHDAERALDRARRTLEGWIEFEYGQNRANAEMSEVYTRHSLEDAEDELRQLEAMYREDELTDATEEIVLRRSRRNLARSHRSAELSQGQREFTAEFSWPISTEMKEEAVIKAEHSLKRTHRQFQLDQEARHAALEKSERGLVRLEERLEKLLSDQGMFELRAPRSGLLLHGGAEDYHPGKAAPRHRRGGRAGVRTALFTIATPDRMGVALNVGESKLSQVGNGRSVQIHGIADDGLHRNGRLVMDAFPQAKSATGPENQYHGFVELAQPVIGALPGQRVKIEINGER